MEQIKKATLVVVMLAGMVVPPGSTALAALEVEGDAYVGVFDKYL